MLICWHTGVQAYTKLLLKLIAVMTLHVKSAITLVQLGEHFPVSSNYNNNYNYYCLLLSL